MRVALSSIPALLVTLALFYLMHYMITAGGPGIDRMDDVGVVDFVRLRRDPRPPPSIPSRRTLPPQPPAPPGPPALAEMTMVKAPAPAAPRIQPATLEPEVMRVTGRPFLGPFKSLVAKPTRVAAKAARIPEVAVRPALVANAGGSGAQRAEAKVPPLGTGGVSGGVGPPGAAAPGRLGDGIGGEGEVIALLKLEPEYPRRAAKRGIEGWVKVEFTITARGSVTDTVVVESRPRRIFDRAAIRSIRKWRFKPRVVEGKPVSRRASQVIEFKLASG